MYKIIVEKYYSAEDSPTEDSSTRNYAGWEEIYTQRVETINLPRIIKAVIEGGFYQEEIPTSFN